MYQRMCIYIQCSEIYNINMYMVGIYIYGEYIHASCLAVHTYGTAYVPTYRAVLHGLLQDHCMMLYVVESLYIYIYIAYQM